MRFFIGAVKYRLKQNFTTVRSLIMLFLALAAAVYPLFGLSGGEEESRPVPIGWADEDHSFYSSELLGSMDTFDMLDVRTGELDELLGELKAGRLEAVFVVNEGFEEAMLSGSYDDTLTMYESPYSSVAGVIAEGVGAQVMHLWLAGYSAKTAAEYDSSIETKVFDEVMGYMVQPIMNIDRIGVQGEMEMETPLQDTAKKSMFTAAALCCLFMLLGEALTGGKEFWQRLMSRNVGQSSYKLSLGIADMVYFLPCAVPAAVLFILAGEILQAVLYVLMFALYLLAFGGVASALSLIKSKTIHMMSITVTAVANLAFGSLLLSLPVIGILPKIAYVLPSRWLAGEALFGSGWALVGAAVCAAVYNALPFIIKKRNKEVL